MYKGYTMFRVAVQWVNLVTSESLRLGLLEIASDIGALASSIQNGVTGLKLEARNVSQLGSTLHDIFQSSAKR